MNDAFTTFKLKFNNRQIFDFAIKVLGDDCGIVDIGHADMIFVFGSEIDRQSVIETLRIHSVFDSPSFKGEADFKIA